MIRRLILVTLLLCSASLLWCQEDSMTAEDLIRMNENILEDSTEYEATYTTSDTTYENNSAYAQEETTQDSLTYRSIEASTWQRIKTDKDFIYTRKKTQPKKKPVDTSWVEPLLKILKFVLILLVIGVVLFIIYFIVQNSDFNYFKKRKKEEEVESGSYEDVYTFTEWDKSLNEAIAQGNFRLAIRILYLQSLQRLHLENHIVYKQEKTNWDYVNQLQQDSLRKNFTQLTKYFDYIWYGHFSIDETRFRELHQQFTQFQHTL